MSIFPVKPLLFGVENQPITNPSWSDLGQAQRVENAKYVLWYFMRLGWTFESVVGMIGNMHAESGLCPTNREKKWIDGVWTGEFLSGCGLIQWTPYTRVTEFLTTWGEEWENLLSNMRGQCRQLYYELDTAQSGKEYVWHLPVYYPPGYDLTKDEFKACTDVARAAGAFVVMRERPATMASGGSLEAAAETVEERQRIAANYETLLRPFLTASGQLNYSYGDFPVWLFKNIIDRRMRR